jgi:carboxylate-amine ligase
MAVRCVSRVRPWLPALLALTAGSPYFQRSDTGYASYRNIVISRWPTGGPPPEFHDVADYEHRVKMLVEAGVISDPAMIYYDVRPSHRYPTLEIRIADAMPLVDDVMVLAALARALVMTAAAQELRGDPPVQVSEEIVRGATWKAARSGLGGMLVDPILRQPVRAPELLRRLVSHVEEALDASGESGIVLEGLDAILGRGTSAERQRRSLSFGLGFDGVVASIVGESRSGW